MRTLAVVSRKGGTGKTTIATHLAVAAGMKGLRTLLIDLDPQKSAQAWFEARSALGSAFAEKPTVETCALENLFSKWMEARREGYDLMVIDTRPTVEADIVESIRSADVCLMVVRPSHFDLKAVAETANLTRLLRKKSLVLINQAAPRRNGFEPEAVLEAYEELRNYGCPVLPVGVRNRLIFQQSARYGRTANELDPKGYAANEIDAAWREVEKVLWAERTYAGAESPGRSATLV